MLRNNNWTITGWFKLNRSDRSVSKQTYFSYGTNSRGGTRFSVTAYYAEASVAVNYHRYGVRLNSLSGREWHHVAIVYTGSGNSDSVLVYIDGKKKQSSTLAGKPRQMDTQSGTASIGRNVSDGKTYNGYIDDLRIYDVALTDQQVNDIRHGRDDASQYDEPPPEPELPTASLSVSPTSIESGQSATLTWTTTDADKVTLDQVNVANNGSKKVSPETTTHYYLKAVGEGGTARDSVTLEVEYIEPAMQCPSDASGQYPDCDCGPGYDYDEGGNRCVVAVQCPAESTGEYPNCLCPSGYDYDKDGNRCTVRPTYFDPDSINTMDNIPIEGELKLSDLLETTSIDNLISSLPQTHKKNVVLVFRSKALDPARVSGDFPRVVSYGPTARMILSWVTDSDHEGYNQVEFLRPMPGSILTFTQGTVTGTYEIKREDIDIDNASRLNDLDGVKIGPDDEDDRFSDVASPPIVTSTGLNPDDRGSGAIVSSITVNGSGEITGVVWSNRGTGYIPPDGTKWDAGVISFNNDTAHVDRPAVCATCHGTNHKPLWGANTDFSMTEQDKSHGRMSRSAYDYLRAAQESNDERLSPLDLSLWYETYDPVNYNTGARQGAYGDFVASDAAMNFMWRHVETIIRTDIQAGKMEQILLDPAFCRGHNTLWSSSRALHNQKIISDFNLDLTALADGTHTISGKYLNKFAPGCVDVYMCFVAQYRMIGLKMMYDASPRVREAFDKQYDSDGELMFAGDGATVEEELLQAMKTTHETIGTNNIHERRQQVGEWSLALPRISSLALNDSGICADIKRYGVEGLY